MASVDMVKKKERVRRCPVLCDKRLLRCVGVVMVIPFRTASCLPAAMTLPTDALFWVCQRLNFCSSLPEEMSNKNMSLLLIDSARFRDRSRHCNVALW